MIFGDPLPWFGSVSTGCIGLKTEKSAKSINNAGLINNQQTTTINVEYVDEKNWARYAKFIFP